jgi:nicotinamide-nucleotide amidase
MTSIFPTEILMLARLVLEECRERRLRIVTAESCTGGLVAGALTEIAGSSDVVDRGFVTYSNRAKEKVLGVPGDLLADMGAVSEPVARMMAEGALDASDAHIAVAITGVAGPGGGTALKPVGLVHFATARANGPILHRRELFGDLGRETVRLESLRTALEMLRERVSG